MRRQGQPLFLSRTQNQNADGIFFDGQTPDHQVGFADSDFSLLVGSERLITDQLSRKT